MLACFDEIQQGLQLVQAAVAALRVVAAALQQGLEGLFLGDMVSQRAISKADVAISAGAASLGDIEGLPAQAQLPCGLLPEMLRLVFAPHTGAVGQIDAG